MAKNTSILLGDYYEEFVAKKVQSGKYSSASEVIRTALRIFEDEEQKKQALLKAIIKGEKSGIKENFNPKEHLKSLNAEKML
jgi:antitoxin ParD1/3/4